MSNWEEDARLDAVKRDVRAENPYAPPLETNAAVGVLSGSREDLLKVAKLQKGVLVCILVQIVAMFGQVFAPIEIGQVVFGLAWLASGVFGAIFVFMLAIKVYGTLLGIVLGVLCVAPCLGIIPLLIVNGKATSVLKQNGIKVGLLGAKLSDVELADIRKRRIT